MSGNKTVAVKDKTEDKTAPRSLFAEDAKELVFKLSNFNHDAWTGTPLERNAWFLDMEDVTIALPDGEEKEMGLWRFLSTQMEAVIAYQLMSLTDEEFDVIRGDRMVYSAWFSRLESLHWALGTSDKVLESFCNDELGQKYIERYSDDEAKKMFKIVDLIASPHDISNFSNFLNWWIYGDCLSRQEIIANIFTVFIERHVPYWEQVPYMSVLLEPTRKLACA